MGVLPLHTIMLIDVITAGFAIGPLLFIQVPQPPRTKAEADAQSISLPLSIWQDVQKGFQYIIHWRGVFIVLIVATILNFLVHPAMSLLPIMVTQYFGQGAIQLGWMNSAWGVGVILGGLTLSAWGGFQRRIVTSLLGMLGMSVGFLVVGLAPATTFWMAWGGLLLAGMMNPIVNGPFFAIMQDVVAPDMQGRVFTTIGSISGAAAPLGMLIAGPVADAFGVQLWFIVAGIIGLAMGIGLPSVKSVMNLEDQRQPVQEPVTEAKPMPG
jgi:DHA3 family macrolide efflux protein-like MFS transporter